MTRGQITDRMAEMTLITIGFPQCYGVLITNSFPLVILRGTGQTKTEFTSNTKFVLLRIWPNGSWKLILTLLLRPLQKLLLCP